MSTSQEILELSRQLTDTLAVREQLLARRRAMIIEWKRTGVKSEADSFSFVRDCIAVNEELLRALRAELTRVRGGAA